MSAKSTSTLTNINTVDFYSEFISSYFLLVLLINNFTSRSDSVVADFVKCEYCGRNFNKTAAERHIPFCKEQKARSAPLKPPASRAQPMRAQNGQMPKVSTL